MARIPSYVRPTAPAPTNPVPPSQSPPSGGKYPGWAPQGGSRSGWGASPSDWKAAHPIGRHAEEFLRANADYAVYLRLRDDDPCPRHWDYTGSANLAQDDGEPCPICWGTGKKVQAFVTPIRTAQGTPGNQADARIQPGYVLNWEISAYLPRSVRPGLQDIVMLVEWNMPPERVPHDRTRRIVTLSDVTQVESINDRFEREVAFVAVTLKSLGVEDSMYRKMIPLTSGLQLLPDIDEQWPRTSYW